MPKKYKIFSIKSTQLDHETKGEEGVEPPEPSPLSWVWFMG